MKLFNGVFAFAIAFIVGSVAFRYIDRLFPGVTTPPAALKRIF